jgi:hypothetical protein
MLYNQKMQECAPITMLVVVCESQSCSHLHACIVLCCIMPLAEARCLLRDLLRGCDWDDTKFIPGMPSHYNPFTPALREQFVREWRTLNDVKKKRQHGSHGHCVPIQSWVLIMTVGLAEAVSLVRRTLWRLMQLHNACLCACSAAAKI